MDVRLAIAVFACLVPGACADAGEAAPPDAAAEVAPEPEPDLLEWEPRSGDAAGEASDAAGDADGDAADTGPAAVFVVGTNPVHREDGVSDFVPVPDGGQVPVVVGDQGLYMVIVAVRTTGLLVSPVSVDAELRYAGHRIAEFEFEGIDLDPMEDGFDYLWDVFLAFEGTPFTGLPLELELDVVGADGKGVSLEQTIVPGW